MTKKKEIKDEVNGHHWTIEVSNIREAVRKLKGQQNKIGHMIWLLKRKNLSYGHQISSLRDNEDDIMKKHSKVKFTDTINEDELEKNWVKLCRNTGLDKVLE